MSQLDNSYGPVTSASAITSTGGKSWVKPRGLLNNWGYTITTAGSTSAVTPKHRLAGHSRVTARLARQVRVRINSLSSTSSTGPTATVVVAGTL